MRRSVIVIIVIIAIILAANLAIFGLATTADAAKINPKNFVGAWLFEEGKGDDVKDITGKGHDGKIIGAKWANGKYGKALEYEKGASVQILSTDDLQVGDQLTMQAWFFAKNINDWRQIIAKSDEYLLRIDPPQEGNKMSAFVKPANNWEPRASAFVPKLETWYHFAAVYDSKLASEQLKVFVNGEQSGVSSRPGKIAKTANPLEFGKWGGGSFFIGIIDEVAILNVALSADEIKSSMDGLDKVIAGTAVNPKEKLAISWAQIKRSN